MLISDAYFSENGIIQLILVIVLKSTWFRIWYAEWISEQFIVWIKLRWLRLVDNWIFYVFFDWNMARIIFINTLYNSKHIITAFLTRLSFGKYGTSLRRATWCTNRFINIFKDIDVYDFRCRSPCEKRWKLNYSILYWIREDRHLSRTLRFWNFR